MLKERERELLFSKLWNSLDNREKVDERDTKLYLNPQFTFTYLQQFHPLTKCLLAFCPKFVLLGELFWSPEQRLGTTALT